MQHSSTFVPVCGDMMIRRRTSNPNGNPNEELLSIESASMAAYRLWLETEHKQDRRTRAKPLRRWAARASGSDAREVFMRACYAYWLASQGRSLLGCPSDKSKHIYAMDRALEDDDGFRQFMDETMGSAQTTKTLYIVLGPIGAGKR